MKKLVIIISLLCSFSITLGQTIEFGGALGYQIGGAVDESEKDQGTDFPGDGLGIQSSPNFGAYASCRMTAKIQLEFSFDSQSTHMNFHNSQTKEINKIADMTVSYYQIGLLYDLSQANIRLFAGGSIGMADLALKGNYNKEKRLVASPVLGAKILASKYLAFRIQTRVFMINMPAGSIFCNTETGECFEHHKSTFVSQIQIMTGIVISI